MNICDWNVFRCDGEIDCEGEEDELECGENEGLHNTKCEDLENHIRCPVSGRCISKEFLCDGDNDCGDYSDETQCGKKEVQEMKILQNWFQSFS